MTVRQDRQQVQTAQEAATMRNSQMNTRVPALPDTPNRKQKEEHLSPLICTKDLFGNKFEIDHSFETEALEEAQRSFRLQIAK